MTMQSNIINAMVGGSRVQVRATSQYKGWLAECDALQAKIDANYPELSDDFFDVVWGGSNTMGEAMFLAGWELRGNPDKLLDLPDGE